VYGEQTSKELIAFLAEHSGTLDTLDKMRLFLCYLATHPEKLDATKHSQWAKLARLSANDMNTVCNLAYLGVAVMKTGERPPPRHRHRQPPPPPPLGGPPSARPAPARQPPLRPAFPGGPCHRDRPAPPPRPPRPPSHRPALPAQASPPPA
jgi:hypothetical protein